MARQPRLAEVSNRVDESFASRCARARLLATKHPAMAELLEFYALVADCQRALLEKYPEIIRTRSSLHTTILDQLDRRALSNACAELIGAIAPQAPPTLAADLEAIETITADEWTDLLDAYWFSGGGESGDVDGVRMFAIEALLQPFAEAIVSEGDGLTESTPSDTRCPRCGGLAVVAALREESHGARRSLLCGLCLTEWPSLRVRCLACGESRFEALPVFRADEFDLARVDACESCKTYLKTIDLTRDGAAVPLVDDLASLPLDLWARERGYNRIRPNLLRI